MRLFYHAVPDRKPEGPFEWGEIERLRKSQRITDKTFIIQEGDDEWIPYPKAVARFGVASGRYYLELDQTSDSRIQRINSAIEACIDTLTRIPFSMLENREDCLRGYLSKLNHFSQGSVMVLLLALSAYSIILSLRFDHTVGILAGLATIPVALVLQYVISLISEANLKMAFGPPIPLLSLWCPG